MWTRGRSKVARWRMASTANGVWVSTVHVWPTWMWVSTASKVWVKPWRRLSWMRGGVLDVEAEYVTAMIVMEAYVKRSCEVP